MLPDGIERAIEEEKARVEERMTFINFVRKGETATSNTDAGRILSLAGDWQMQADIRGRATFLH